MESPNTPPSSVSRPHSAEADVPIQRVRSLRQLGRLNEAIGECQAALEVNPQDDGWLIELALCYLTTQQFGLAMEACQTAISIAPTVAAHYYQLAIARTVAGMRREAIESYERALELDPRLGDAHLKLGQVLLSLGRRMEAIDHFKLALQIQTDLTEAHLSWAEALLELGEGEEAKAHIATPLSNDPGLLISQGVRLQVLGEFAAARECFLKSIQFAPRSGAAYYWLVRGEKMSEAERPLIEQMMSLSRDPKLPMADRIMLQYGLGKAKEDLKEFRQAMNHYDEANGLAQMMKRPNFDRDGLVNYNNWRLRAYETGPVHHFQAFGNPSEKPLFVIGMIRSGTTLVEQMLSNHPDVGPCGEMLYWNEKQEAFNSRIANGSISGEFISETAGEYLALLDQMAPDQARAIDKMPLNYFLVGAIHVALPNARFIHVNRNPIDTCLSIYTTYFEASPPFAHSQDNIAFYYREYQRLMAHWRRLLPADRFLDIQYEALVTEPEATMRAIMEFVGLNWNDACTQPERNQRAVRTPSAWQVRQPIYRSSNQRWKNFAPWLGEIAELGHT